MRRNKRGIYEDTDNYKVILLIAGGILLVAIISFFVVYGIYNDKLEAAELATINENNSRIDVSNSINNSTVVSSSIGKNVNEMKNDVAENTLQNNISNAVSLTTVESSSNKVSNEGSTSNVTATSNNNTTPKTNTQETQQPVQEEVKEEVKEEKEPSFISPIEDGEVIREFAKDNLVYSDTLEEWITHLGIDIKAPKTTVVKAAEAGEVESIKNDPRYGLTVIIKHTNDYKTVYSNLLTTEFVNVGDKVEIGQSIGTVGNSAAFEIADEPHLHFEIIKNGEKVDPTLYFK